MIGRGSHDALTKSMFPWMEENFIHQINTIIDNPTTQQKKAHDMMRANSIGFNPVEQNFGLWSKKGNHRQYNHNMWTGAQIAAQYGTQGWQAFLAHMVQDLQSDMLRDTLGYHGRNLVEAGMMYNLENAHNIYKRRKELGPYMPIPSMSMLPGHFMPSQIKKRQYARQSVRRARHVYPKLTPIQMHMNRRY